MSDLFDTKNVERSHVELQERCKTIIFTVTQNQVENVEKSTRLQVKSCKLNYFRSGRITASKLRSACCTDTVSTSKSLIKKICYPVKMQTEWDCEHENAVEKYASFMRENHLNFVVRDLVFYISINKPFLGASPDAIVSYECCGATSQWTTNEIFWRIIIPKSEIFFMNCILPESFEKFYTRAEENENVSTFANDHTLLEAVFCYCKQPDFVTMTRCNNI